MNKMTLEAKITANSSDERVGPSVLAAKNLYKSYGPSEAVHDVTLELSAGEIVGLIGDNGAGKSTFIKVLVGVEQPDAGEIWWMGRKTRWASPADARKQGIETVFQDLALCDELSIWRNFFLGREASGWLGGLARMPRRAMRARAVEALKEYGLSIRSPDLPVKSLSGGERQGVAIVRAAWFGARALVLDEPTAALSVVESEKVFSAVRSAAARGVPSIVIMHSLAGVMELADRVHVLAHGRTVAQFRRGELSLKEVEDIVAGRRRYGSEQVREDGSI